MTRRAWVPVCGVMLAAGLAAQDAAPRQTLRLRSRVDSVLVDVYPTRDGRAVGDLTQSDFDLLEDGVPQRIEMFERVAVRLPGSPADRSEPTTVGASNDAAGDPRSRLFVVYLDTYHTPQDRRPDGTQLTRPTTDLDVQAGTRIPSASAGLITNALSGLLLRLIGPDDLVGLYTPEMPIGAITFTRGVASIDDFLRRAPWQRLGTAEYDLEPRELMWRACYPKQTHDHIVYEMIARRRQAAALDGLRNLVSHVQGIRDGRTAIVVVSTGWYLYRRNEGLAAPLDGRVPGQPGISVSPLGKPSIGGTTPGQRASECDQDRQTLADLDLARDFNLILQDANRANVTFYPIDPAGPRKLTGSAAGWAINYGQTEILRTMATATDGIAIVDTTDIDRRVRRIVDDLSSYYLLGYTPTNTRQDGKFRTIAVRVKRDGVAVRARSGYRELTTAEAAPRAVAIAVPDPAGVAQQNALGALATSRLVWQCVPAESECGLERLGIDRRGPYSGTSFQPTSDPLFRRTERLRVSAPATSACTGSIRLLDRRGNPLPVPLTLDQRQEAGLAVLTGEIVLAPLGQADYLIEVTVRSAGREERCFVAFRIVP